MKDPKGSYPTLTTIADHCGVTKTTVSRALRNDHRVGAATQQKIVETANRLGYRPNPLVSAHMAYLRSNRQSKQTATLALLACDLDHPYRFTGLKEVLRGIEDRADRLGYLLEHFWLGEPRMSVERLADILYARAIVGILILPGRRDNFSLDLKWEQLASVTFGYRLASPQLQRVTNNHYHSMILACRKLQELGHRRIGHYFIKSDDAKVNNLFLAAYTMFQAELPEEERMPTLYEEEWKEPVYQNWVKQNHLDAVITLHSPVFEWTQRAGIRVPEDLSLVHLDLDETKSGWGGIFQNKYVFGSTAVNILSTALMQNDYGLPSNPLVTLVQGQWINGPTITARGRY